MRTLLALWLSVSALLAQFAVGTRDVAWPNTTGQGTASLTARVYYPAATAGSGAPLLPRSGGWPVLVFLHGFATSGTLYTAFGQAFAARGFAVVVSTTTTFDNQGQEYDGRALYPAVLAANLTGPFAGGFDVQRVALAVHSMGGGNVANVFANNPGYRCGFAVAPVEPRPGNAARVVAPVAIVAGQGDAIAPWQTFAQPYYQGLTAVDGVRSLYLMNGDASHTNLAGLFVSGGAGAQVFARVVEVGVGWCQHWLGLSPQGLEQALGPAARAEPRLVSLGSAVTAPQVWLAGPLALGTSVRTSVAAEPGLAGVVAALAPGQPTATPFGWFRLDPGTAYVALVGSAGSEARFDGQTVVPAAPGFLGLSLWLQAFGTGAGGALRLGNAVGVVVGS